MEEFKAYVMRSEDGKKTAGSVETLARGDLPTNAGDVLVRVEYSGLNYKDGLVVDGNKGRLARNFPHVPGIDLAGEVIESGDGRYKAGDKVVLTGWRVGEMLWGGYSQLASVSADYLVPLPSGMTTRQAMAIGTAGFTSMLAIDRLEREGLTVDKGEVLVTGAAGGVGSVSIAILSNLGYSVVGSSGRASLNDYLISLGASRVIDRSELSEPSERPLESETWAGCVDSVGGSTLGRVLGQMKYGGGVSACGLAGGAELSSTVLPFLLRGVSLFGIDSVMQPYEDRVRIWQRLGSDLPLSLLESAITEHLLEDIESLAVDILGGKVRGRTVINLQ